MAKGYNPYNNVGSKAKPKRPAWKKPSPNNPYNNAGKAIKPSSRGPTSLNDAVNKATKSYYKTGKLPPSDNAIKAGERAWQRDFKGTGRASAGAAQDGMYAKNAARKAAVDKARAARPSKIGWAKAGGAKARGSAVKWGTGTANKAVVAVDNTLKKAGYRGIKDAMGALKSFEKAGNKVAAGALKDVATRAAASGAGRFAAGVALGTAAAANVLSAGAAGYAIGTGIYNKNATKIQDTLDKYVRNRRKK